MDKPAFFLPQSKYLKDTNPDYSYNQKSYAGGFRNDCSGFVSNVLRTNGYAVPMDFTTTNIKNWAAKSNPYFDKVGTGQTLKASDIKDGDVVMLGSGHTGIVFTGDDKEKYIADWGSTSNGYRKNPVPLEKALTKTWYGQLVKEVIRPKPETYHAENDQTLPGHTYANPSLSPVVAQRPNAGAGRGFIHPPFVVPPPSEETETSQAKSDSEPTGISNTQSEKTENTEGKNETEKSLIISNFLDQKIYELPEPGDSFYDALINAITQTDVSTPNGDLYAAINNGTQTDAGSSLEVPENILSLAEFVVGMSGKISHEQQASLNQTLAQVQNLTSDEIGVYMLSGTAALVSKQHGEVIGLLRQRDDWLELLQENQTRTFNQLGQLEFSRSISAQTDTQGHRIVVEEIVQHLAKGEEIASIKTLVNDVGASIVNTYRANGHVEEATYSVDDSGKPVLTSNKVISYSQAERNQASLDVGLAGAEFIQSLRHGNKVQAASSLIRLVNNAEIASNKMPSLGALGTGLSGAISLISSLDSWGQASEGERIALTARSVLGANELAKAFSTDGKTGFLDVASGINPLNIASGVMAFADLAASLKTGNPLTIATSFMSTANSVAALMSEAAIFTPEAIIAVAVINIIFGGLFGGGGHVEYPEPPPAGCVEIGVNSGGSLVMLFKDKEGSIYQTRNLKGEILTNNGKATDSLNWNMGADILSRKISSLITDVQAEAEKKGTHLVLQRLPSLQLVSYPSFENGADNFFFAIQFQNPQTRVSQFAAAVPKEVNRIYKEVMKLAGAEVDETEFEQIQMKMKAGDSYAAETEGQFIDRVSGSEKGSSLLSKSESESQLASNTQTYSLLSIDLEKNGIVTKSKQISGMNLEDVIADTTQGRARLDVDNDGYMELTQWIGASEAILGIDRNDDGVLSSADELFTGGELSDSAEQLGLQRLAFLDANKDGLLDDNDPYFKVLRLWVDINGDARTGVGELHTMQEADVVSIDLRTSELIFSDNQALKIQKTQLQADVRGVAISSVSNGNNEIINGQYNVKKEGISSELIITSEAANDLSEILKLVRPDSKLTEKEKKNLRILAEKYGVDLTNPAALLGLGGGGNAAGSPTSTVANNNDIFTIDQRPDAEEVKQALYAFFSQIIHNPSVGPDISNRIFQGTEDIQIRITASELLTGLKDTQLLSVQDARRGAVLLTNEGNIEFTPAKNQHGTAYFTYTAKDTLGRTSTAMVWLTITETNDAPIATKDNFTTREDESLLISSSQLLANDEDVDLETDLNEKIKVIAVSNALHGTVSLVNGQIEFNPEKDYQGEAGFKYTISDAAGLTSEAMVTLSVVGVNDSPINAENRAIILARPDALLRIESSSLLSYVNDVDLVYGDSLKLNKVKYVSAGKAWQQNDGSILFKPGAIGNAELQIEVSDSQGAIVIIPIFINISNGNTLNAAVLPGPDQATEDTSIRINSTEYIVSVVEVKNGEAYIENNSVIFNPAQNYNGFAQIIYTIRLEDGTYRNKTVDLSIAAVNDAPVVLNPMSKQYIDEDNVLSISETSLLATMSDVDTETNGQQLRIERVSDPVNGRVQINANRVIEFLPNTNYNGPAAFTYWVTDDSGASVSAKVEINVRPVNDVPQPLPLTFQLLEDEQRIFNPLSLLTNPSQIDIDTQTNGDQIKITRVSVDSTNSVKGNISLDSNGFIKFIPIANYYGNFIFSYTVTDKAGAQGQNTVSLNIASVNDAPIANGNAVLTNGLEDTVKLFSFSELTRNFTDIDGDILRIKSITSVYGGSVIIQNDTVYFTPTRDFNGIASFNYTVEDPSGATANSNATFAIANVNDAPVAAYKRIEERAYEDAELRIGFSELLSGSYDADSILGDRVSLKSVTSGNNCSAWIDWGRQQVVFKGNANFNGWTNFTYTISDTSGATGTQTVDVNIIAVNDAPSVRSITVLDIWEDGYYANNNQDPTKQDNVRITNFLNTIGSNDVDGDSLSFGEFWNLNHISEIKKEGNDLVFKTDHNYSGSAGFNYRVRDNQGSWADGLMNFNVMSQNDSPTISMPDQWTEGGTQTTGDARNRSTVSYPYDRKIRIQVNDVDSGVNDLSVSIQNAPAHGVLRIQAAVDNVTYATGRGPSATSTIYYPGKWDLFFDNRSGDPFNDKTGFDLRVTDRQGGSALQHSEVKHNGSSASRGGGGKPVAIDLDGNGLQFTNINQSKILYDINGDGAKDLLSWTAPNDGLIVFDKNDDGLIQELDEVSFLSYVSGSRTDLEGLNGFDTDKDGKFTSNDALWKKFGIWQDKNQNGTTDPGEFKNLDDWFIHSIDLHSDKVMDQVGDVYILGKSTYEKNDGTKGVIADTAFRYLDGADINQITDAKTFTVDISDIVQQRINDSKENGISDEQLQSLLQKFITDIANADVIPDGTANNDALAWIQDTHIQQVNVDEKNKSALVHP